MCAFHSFLKQQLRVFCASYVHLICDNGTSSAYTFTAHKAAAAATAVENVHIPLILSFCMIRTLKLSSYLQQSLRHVDHIAQI